MLAASQRHAGCLQRLLTAAAIPANLPAEAVYAVILNLSLQAKGSCPAHSTSLRAVCQWLSVTQSAAEPAQLPLLRSLHSTPAARAVEDDEPAVDASAAALSTADPSTGLPAQAPAAAAAQVLPAGPANAALDLARAVDTERHRQQHQQPPAQRSKLKSKKTPLPTPAAEQPRAFSSRWARISEQLQQDAQQVQRSERAQQVTQQLQQLENQHKQRRQQGVPPAPAPQVQQQQGPVQMKFDLKQELRKLKQKRPLSVKQLAKQKKQQLLQQHQEQPSLQQQQELSQQQQEHKAQQQVQQAVGLPSLQAVVRAAPRRQLPQGALLEQLQGARAQQQLLAAEAAAASMPQRPFGGYGLPLLVQFMLQQQPAAPAASAAAATAAAPTQPQSFSSPCVSSSDAAAAADTADNIYEDDSGAGSQARYSNWPDFDVSQAVPRDAHDTFLGVWPDPSCLPELQLPELSDGDGSYLGCCENEEWQEGPPTGAGAAAAGAQLGQQQLQELQLEGDMGWLGTAAAGDDDDSAEEDSSSTTAEAAAAAGSDADAEAGSDADAVAAVGSVLLDGWLDGDGESEGESEQGDEWVQEQGESDGQTEQQTSSEQGLLLQMGAAAEGAARAAADSSDWEDDAAATVAASGLWIADGDGTAAAAADTEAAIQQLWEADVQPVAAAAAAAVLPAAPVLTHQQQLQMVAATAGLSWEEAASALRTAPDDSWRGAHGGQQSRWSVGTMFDRIDCLGADAVSVPDTAAAAAAAGGVSAPCDSSSMGGLMMFGQQAQQKQQQQEDIFDGYSWALNEAPDSDSQLSDGEFRYSDSLEAVAAAQQALRHSDRAAAAAAAANLPQRQWPSHIPITLAWQQAVEELKLQPELAGVFCLDSSSSTSSDGGIGSSSSTALQPGGRGQQPYAWMCGPTAAAAAAGTGAASQPYGVQYILQCVQAMHPSANWRFEYDAGRSANSRGDVSGVPPVDSSLQQYVASEQFHAHRQQRQLQQIKQVQQLLQQLELEQQQQLQLPEPEAARPAQTWLQFAGDLWTAAAESYGFSGSSSSISSGGGSSSHSSSKRAAADDDWSWDDQEQQEYPAAAAAAAAAAARSSARIQADTFMLKPHQGPHNVAERLLLARVTQMSAGTVWEPVMWSVFTQQATAVPQGRSLLQPVVAAGAQRKPLSQPLEQVMQQHGQRMQDAQQQLGRKRAELRAQGRAALQQQAAVPEEWYAPLLYAAYAGVHKTGQLLLARLVSLQYHAVQDAATLSSSSSVGVSSEAAATAAAPVAVPVTVGLQAVPAYSQGWNLISRSWEEGYLKMGAAAVPSRAQLSAELQQEGLLAQQAIQQARARAPTNLRLHPGAAEGVILQELQACDTAAALLRCMQQYSHYLDRYPNLPAVAMQQASKLWTQATAAAAPVTAEAAAAPDAAGGSIGRRHKPLPLALQPVLAAAGSALPSSSSSIDFSVYEATAAAGGNMDAVQSSRVQVPTLVASAEAPAAAGAVFETLVQWFSTEYNRPKQLLGQYIPPALHDDTLASSSSSAGASSGAGPSRADCLLQLLTLGITGRGTVLPSSLNLLQLLQMQEVNKLSAAAVFDFSQQLLAPATALQYWPGAEQQAAFRLVKSGLVQLQPQALLQLLQTLTQQQHLAPLQQQPAALYRAVLARLAVQAQVVLQGDKGPIWQEFMAAAPQLLQLAQQACLSAGALALKSNQEGVVLPGSKHFTEAVSHATYKGAPEHREWAIQQHRDFFSQLREWRKQAAATPAVADAAVKVAASGHLQLVAAVLKLAMAQSAKQQQQQQFDAGQAAELLQLLAFSRPFLTHERSSDAAYVAEKFGENAEGLRLGSQEFSRLPEAIAKWLSQQQGQRDKPLQQLSPSAALKTIWAAVQLQLPEASLSALVGSLCEPQPAAAARAWSSSSSRSGNSHAAAAASLIQQVIAPGAGAEAVSRTCLSSWPLLTLHQLLELMRLHNGMKQVYKDPWISDVAAAVAAQRIRELAADIAAGGTGVASTVDLAAYAAESPAAPAVLELGRRRGSVTSSSSSSSAGSDRWFSQAADAACDTAYVYAHRNLYQPQLIEAVQALVHAVARDQRNRSLNGSKVQFLTGRMLHKVLYSLAAFNHCSAETSAALRRLLPRFLGGMREVGLSRTVWALAVLDERDQKVWASLRDAIKKRQHERTAPKGGGDAGNAAAGSAEREGWIQSHLHQARVFVDHCVPGAAPLLPQELAQQALSNHVTLSQDPTVSQLQRDVGHALGVMTSGPKLVDYELEHKTILGSTDIKVTMKGARRKVAIEVDGPTHFAANAPYKQSRRTGSTVLRDRLLEVSGFSVLPLAYWDWKETPHDARSSWLEKKLVEAANSS